MAESETENIFEVNNVTYRYNEITAVKNISLAIKSKQRIAILGANGSGKSTLLRLLNALYFPDSGTVKAFGKFLTEENFADSEFAYDFRQKVGFVFQNSDVQLFNSTVFDELAFGLLQLRRSKAEIRQRISEMLEFFEITNLKDRSPHRLSGGEKKRVALASVLIIDPQIILLDEPTAALDPKSRRQIVELLNDFKNQPKTIITATHDLDVVEEIADYCFLFQNGELAAEGKPQEIITNKNLLKKTNLIYSRE